MLSAALSVLDLLKIKKLQHEIRVIGVLIRLPFIGTKYEFS